MGKLIELNSHKAERRNIMVGPIGNQGIENLYNVPNQGKIENKDIPDQSLRDIIKNEFTIEDLQKFLSLLNKLNEENPALGSILDPLMQELGEELDKEGITFFEVEESKLTEDQKKLFKEAIGKAVEERGQMPEIDENDMKEYSQRMEFLKEKNPGMSDELLYDIMELFNKALEGSGFKSESHSAGFSTQQDTEKPPGWDEFYQEVEPKYPGVPMPEVEPNPDLPPGAPMPSK